MAGVKEEAYFDEAERLYVKEGKSPSQIAEILPVSENTLYAWKKKGGWGQKRKAALGSSRGLADRLRRILEEQIEALEGEKRIDAAAYDGIFKAFSVIEKLERSGDLRTQGVEVMQEFTGWLKAQEIEPGELQLIGGRIRGWFRSLE